MKEEKNLELLSRLLDGDTTPPEEEQLRTLMAEDPQTAQHYEELRRNRQLLGAIAEADEPPAVLDDLMVELRRHGRPTPRGWLIPALAAAAALAIGFAVVLQMKRHTIPADFLQATNPTPSPIFALSALPEAEEDSPLGPLEELLASPYPAPAMLEAPPMLVLGPLPEPPPE